MPYYAPGQEIILFAKISDLFPHFRERSTTFDALVSIKYPLHFLSVTATVLCLVVLTYDRYLLITEPLHYYNIMTKTRFIVLSLALWIYSSLIALSSVFWHNKKEILDRLEPVKLCIFSFFHAISIEEMTYVGIPTSALCIGSIVGMNFKIYRLASKTNRTIHATTAISNSQRSGPNNFESQSIERNAHESSAISHSNGSSKRNHVVDCQTEPGHISVTELGNPENRPIKRNFKQAKTVLIMVGCFLLGFTPYAVLCAIQTYGLYFSVTLSQIEELAMYCFISNSMTNPIIYSYRMKHFRHGITKLIKL